MRQEVIAGQYLDLAVAEQKDATDRQVRRIAMLKSGLYSVVEPLTIGAVLAGGSDDIVKGLRSVGRPVGEAFQLRDDLLGMFGDQAVLGKSVDSDIEEGKKHLLFVTTLRLASGDDRTFFAERWGAPDLAADEIERLRTIVDSSGARAELEGLIRSLRTEADRALAEIAVDGSVRDALHHLTGVVIDREQ
jgi:geranylgeranyl diphosphate synthase type I